VACQGFNQSVGIEELRREGGEFDGVLQVEGAVDGVGGGAAGVEEGGVVSAFLGSVQVGAFDVGAEEGGRVRDRAGGEGGQDLDRCQFWSLQACSLLSKF
jgi:hypothetical protein